MGRFKNIEIQGLLIDNFGKGLVDSINTIIKNSNSSEEEVFKKLAPEFDTVLQQYEELIASFYLEKNKFNLTTFLKFYFKNQNQIVSKNRNSFNSFIMYIECCAMIYDKMLLKIKRKKLDNIIKLNIALYGLIIRRAQEIQSLLMTGYIDGAMVLWRSLYENSITLLVLAIESKPGLSEKYLAHSVRNSKKKVLSYHKVYTELNFKPLPKSTDKILKSEIDKFTKLYGKDFLENEYGWADDIFPGKQKANFRLLEERVQMNLYRPYYLWCCDQVHAGFNGLKLFMDGRNINLRTLLNQKIDLRSFVDPMQFTLSILHEVNDYILYEFSIEEEYAVNKLLLRKVFEHQQNTFNSLDKKIPKVSKKSNANL